MAQRQGNGNDGDGRRNGNGDGRCDNNGDGRRNGNATATTGIVGGNGRRQATTRTRRIQVTTTEWVNDRPTRKESLDVKASAATVGLMSGAPIKMVDGLPWSPVVFRFLCLLGKTLEVAWVRVFV